MEDYKNMYYKDVYYVIRRWRNGGHLSMKIVGEFDNLEDARKHCCSKLNIKYNPEKFEEDFKMCFWDSRKILFYFII